jgi:tRNA(fMet)-specific endonuclease VapC
VLKYLLDTDCGIYLLIGRLPALTARVAGQPAGSVGISAISLAEMAVKYGLAAYRAPELAGFLEEIALQPFDEAAAKAYGTLPFRRGSFDRLIAGHALSLDVTLVTNNERDFKDVPRLRTENWTGP